jgi:hypothetical protein
VTQKSDNEPQSSRSPLSVAAQATPQTPCRCCGQAKMIPRRTFVGATLGAAAGLLTGQAAVLAQQGTIKKKFYLVHLLKRRVLSDDGTLLREVEDEMYRQSSLDSISVNDLNSTHRFSIRGTDYTAELFGGPYQTQEDVCAAARPLIHQGYAVFLNEECLDIGGSGGPSAGSAGDRPDAGQQLRRTAAASVAGAAAGTAAAALEGRRASPATRRFKLSRWWFGPIEIVSAEEQPSAASEGDQAEPNSPESTNRCKQLAQRVQGYPQRDDEIRRAWFARNEPKLSQLRRWNEEHQPKIEELRILFDEWDAMAKKVHIALAFGTSLLGRFTAMGLPVVLVGVATGGVHLHGKWLTGIWYTLKAGVEKMTENALNHPLDLEAMQSLSALERLLNEFQEQSERLNVAKKQYYKENWERSRIAEEVRQDLTATNKTIIDMHYSNEADRIHMQQLGCREWSLIGIEIVDSPRGEIPVPHELANPLPDDIDMGGDVLQG